MLNSMIKDFYFYLLYRVLVFIHERRLDFILKKKNENKRGLIGLGTRIEYHLNLDFTLIALFFCRFNFSFSLVELGDILAFIGILKKNLRF